MHPSLVVQPGPRETRAGSTMYQGTSRSDLLSTIRSPQPASARHFAPAAILIDRGPLVYQIMRPFSPPTRANHDRASDVRQLVAQAVAGAPPDVPSERSKPA